MVKERRRARALHQQKQQTPRSKGGCCSHKGLVPWKCLGVFQYPWDRWRSMGQVGVMRRVGGRQGRGL